MGGEGGNRERHLQIEAWAFDNKRMALFLCKAGLYTARATTILLEAWTRNLLATTMFLLGAKEVLHVTFDKNGCYMQRSGRLWRLLALVPSPTPGAPPKTEKSGELRPSLKIPASLYALVFRVQVRSLKARNLRPLLSDVLLIDPAKCL